MIAHEAGRFFLECQFFLCLFLNTFLSFLHFISFELTPGKIFLLVSGLPANAKFCTRQWEVLLIKERKKGRFHFSLCRQWGIFCLSCSFSVTPILTRIVCESLFQEALVSGFSSFVLHKGVATTFETANWLPHHLLLDFSAIPSSHNFSSINSLCFQSILKGFCFQNGI